MARASLLLSVLGIFIWAVPSAAGDRHVASDADLVGSLGAYGGVVAWSDSGSYFSSSGGNITRLGINTPRGGAVVGLDLGPSRSHGIAGVYQHCKNSGDESGPVGCDVYRYGFGSRHSEPVPRAATRLWEEDAPSIWRGRVVFVRTGTTDNRVCGDEPLRGCGMFATNPFARLHKQEVYETDLRGRVVAFIGRSDHLGANIFVKRFDRHGRGRACRIASTRGGESPAPGDLGLTRPQLDGRYIYWTRVAPGQSGGAATGHATVSEGRRLLPSRTCRPRGREQRTRVLLRVGPHGTYDFNFLGYAVDRGRLYYATIKQSYDPPYPYQSDIWEAQPAFSTPK